MGFRNISAWSIRNPVPSIVLFLILSIAGFAGWRAKRSAGDVKLALRSDLSPQGSDD